VSHTDSNLQIDTARQAKLLQDNATKAERHETIVTQLSVKPEMDVTELASQVGVSRQTVYRDLAELETAGKLHKNGDGWKVTS
jgi:DeoR/GlpR family transcriptional regulator of sugar metabolism